MRARHSLFTFNNNHISDLLSNDIDIAYCVFVGVEENKLAAWMATGSTINNFHNNTIVSDPTDMARGWYNETASTFELENCIFTQLKLTQFSANQTYNYCCFYDNLTSPTGDTNSITGDPNLEDIANFDFRLGSGSSCIGTGLDLGTEELGIETADWGNGVDELPVITTKLQTNGAWDVGAYVS
jgi:hypothetical protein